MRDYFKILFKREPIEKVSGDYYFGSDCDGDNFDNKDAELWLNGVFKDNWDAKLNVEDEMFKIFYPDILDTFSENPSSFMEIACGPGMGLTPIILSKYPDTSCLATDACSLLIKSWRQYINSNLKEFNIDLASFSVMDIPIKDNSLDLVTSFIGISSTRAGEQGKFKALDEVYRVLKKGGRFITVENEWANFEDIQEVFRLWGRPVWTGMKEETSWHEKIDKSGFTIEKADKTFFRYLTRSDNDLGEQADKYGIKIGMKFTLLILRK